MQTRWQESQAREKAWWKRWKGTVQLNDVKAELVQRASFINKYLPTEHNLKLLQIGPAANGEIHFLSGERFAIDPLASFFKATFPELMDPKVEYIEGKGEEIPFPDKFFDAILIINVLDHCQDPILVLKEIERCLKPSGRLFLDLTLYSPLLAAIHSIFSFIDPEHPHALTQYWLNKHVLANKKIIYRGNEKITAPHNAIKQLILTLLNLLRLGPQSCRLVIKY